jgi:hypothetical protein
MNSSCTVPGCEARRYAHGWCVTHYRRWQRHGDVRAGIPVRRRTRSGDSYAAVRGRLVRERGPAAEQACADCTGPAACWSYEGTDPDERIDSMRGTRYSLELARYRPRCRYCHRRFLTTRAELSPDRRATRGTPFDIERAAELYRAGASCRGIGSLMGVSATATRRALRDHGVQLRPPTRRTIQPRTD